MNKNKALIAVVALALMTASCNSSRNKIDVEYISDPCLIPVKGNKFKLCDNMIVHIDNEYHAVPKGFKTDLASVPRIMWPIFSPTDYDSIAPAVLHDWHYCCSPEVSRKKADDSFYYALRAHGMGKTRAFIYYMGVRCVGWAFYQHGLGLANHAGEFQKQELQGVYEDVNYRMG